MKRLKQFIDNVAIDKLRHNLLGDIINPLVILPLAISYSLLGAWIGVVLCVVFHVGIEYWQKTTGKGVFDKLDAVWGSWSAVKLGLIITIVALL